MEDEAVKTQRLLIMRHGERLDTRDRNWKKTAARPYDTPITKHGEAAAYGVGQHRFPGKGVQLVYSSPFLRCLQTAQQVCNALGLPGMHTYSGLSEIIAAECGMRGPPEVPASDVEQYGVNILKPDKSPVAQYPETVKDAIARYLAVFKHLADQHWPDNLLLVTHEYGVMQAMALGGCRDQVEATYCGHVELSRTDGREHSWKIEGYVGVYKYDNIFDDEV